MIRVQRNVIFLESVDVEETTSGGIILAGAKRSDNRARITDIHPDTSNATGLVVGNLVLVNPFAVREVVIGAVTKLAIVPSDILAQLIEENTNEA